MSEEQTTHVVVAWPVRVCVAIFCFVLGIGGIFSLFPEVTGIAAICVFGATLYFGTKLYSWLVRKAAVAYGLALAMCIPLLGLCSSDEGTSTNQLLDNELTNALNAGYPRQFPILPPGSKLYDYERFSMCFESLYKITYDQLGSSEYDKVVRMLSRDIGWHIAQDVAAEASIRTCRRHAHAPVDHLPSFYTRVAQRHLKTFIRKNPAQCAFEDWDDNYTRDPDHDIQVQRAWCGLTEQEQNILRLTALGYEDVDIAKELQITPEAARKRLERARKSFLNNMNE